MAVRVTVVMMILWFAWYGVALGQRVSHDESSSEPPTRLFSRVRTEQNPMARLIAVGYMQSLTFRGLVQEVERLNVLVFVFEWPSLSSVGGCLEVMGEANGQKTLIALVNPNLSFMHSIAMIAHELQHAIEVASAPGVVDEKSLRRFYERVGMPVRLNARSYDTAAARDAGAAVLSELRAVGSIEAGRSWPEVLLEDAALIR